MVLIAPKTTNLLAKSPQQFNQKKISFLDSKRLPYWAMLEIQVGFQHKYDLLACACFAADVKQKAKRNQNCFVKQDQNCHNDLEKFLQKWCSVSNNKKT